MGASNWLELTGALSLASLDRGVTAGVPKPPGGGSFVYGFNSLVAAGGAAALYTQQTNFNPMGKGGRITGAVQRKQGGGNTKFAPFFFFCLQGTSVNDRGYLFGLSDADPHRIMLAKRAPAEGLPDEAPNPLVNRILARSQQTYSIDTWHHLRLDVIVNPNGDVVLKAFANDLTAHALGTAPTWVAIPGMEMFIDDSLSVNSGSAAFTSGRAGFGMWVNDITRRSFFDHIEIARQL